jgi:hypothetical protein
LINSAPLNQNNINRAIPKHLGNPWKETNLFLKSKNQWQIKKQLKPIIYAVMPRPPYYFCEKIILLYFWRFNGKTIGTNYGKICRKNCGESCRKGC